jgi:hypothetical protein
VPYLPLVAAPLANLEDASQAIQFNQPNSTTTCTQPIQGSSAGEKLTTAKRQSPGFRFLIGVTPLPDAKRYLLQTAALETTTATYVAPSTTSLKAAVSLLKGDPTTGTWPIPYGTFQTSTGSAAYPGTMVVYAAVPTSGLTAANAQDYAELLKFAATTGQTPGPGVGQLPPGYLPLTAADGLGTLSSYTLAAVTDVAKQNGQVPSLDGSVAGSSGSSASPLPTGSTPAGRSATTAATGTGGFAVSSFVPFTGHFFAATAVRSLAGEGAAATTTHSASNHVPANGTRSLIFDPTADVRLWIGGMPAPLVFGLALLGVIAIPVLYRVGRKRKRW